MYTIIMQDIHVPRNIRVHLQKNNSLLSQNDHDDVTYDVSVVYCAGANFNSTDWIWKGLKSSVKLLLGPDSSGSAGCELTTSSRPLQLSAAIKYKR